ncbi:MAG: hemolysin family protein [Treponema sp.]|uniref:hemolysin family protein n=1 Tax=Treponema sp. TaxID=166 RepID=UPI00298EAD3D|nr:hemolysin family protein [Treponema sp.]MCI5695862.1 hemolysin family protein [Spirochaetia bacterium]MDD5812504.1 hemolysin family protein [Treponema sp.]MDY5884910.1 hemolysin family protein [Treponema sp.]
MSLFGFGTKKNKKENSVESQEQKTTEELLEEEKEDMIQGVEELSTTSVKEVMIPRIDVDFINIETDRAELLEKISDSGHSRFPVYKDSIDNVIGVLYVKDLIRCFSKEEPFELEKIIRKAYFVPETKRIDSLLREFKRRHIHIAMAVDEYGGLSGIVCMEDIIEEIVGDIQDEFDNERDDIVSLGKNIWLVDGRENLSDLNEEIGSTFPQEEFDTLGGFVLDLFGKIPVKYEKMTWNNYDFIIQDMDVHRIDMIKVVCHDNEGGEKDEKE